MRGWSHPPTRIESTHSLTWLHLADHSTALVLSKDYKESVSLEINVSLLIHTALPPLSHSDKILRAHGQHAFKIPLSYTSLLGLVWQPRPRSTLRETRRNRHQRRRAVVLQTGQHA